MSSQSHQMIIFVTGGYYGDVELQLDAGKYWISVWCIDAEGDEITVKWEAPLFNLTNEFHGAGEAHGYVEFTIPPQWHEKLEI